MKFQLHHGNCIDVLRTMNDNSIDAIVTDPPYGLKFMGRKWDYDVPSTELWAECLRVLKPGGHLLAFAGTRTQHRMAVRIEDAGFEIRDMIAWVYGAGFPKSLDVSKAIDKAAGAVREVVGFDPVAAKRAAAVCTSAFGDYKGQTGDVTAPATDDARQWQGWGTALKPALEPITVARKPLVGTVAANVLAHGTGALNIDGCRVPADDGANRARPPRTPNAILGGGKGTNLTASEHDDLGRWPANLIHDGSDEVAEVFGGPARFFYCAKASKRDRDEGLEHMEAVHRPNGNKWTDQDYRVSRGERPASAESGPRKNVHPTVKPTDLMRYLCRLVAPPGGVVLDPFTGSGSTGKAALLEGFQFIGIEREQEYIEIASARINSVANDNFRMPNQRMA